MIATAIHAPLPAHVAHYFGATLHEASGVICRGAADGGLPNISQAEIKKGMSLCAQTLAASEDFEDTLLDATREQLAEIALNFGTFANMGDALKIVLDTKLNNPRSTIEARISDLYKPLIEQFLLVNERVTEIVQMAEHLIAAPVVDEDSDDFGAFLVSIGNVAIA